jgi:glycerophosphoryl diester phosphodiesterase
MKKKAVRVILWLILALVLIGIIMALMAQPVVAHQFFNGDGGGVLVMAHRGGRALWPENTLYAFEHSLALGVDVLELDVHSTKDGTIVVMHDKTVDRTTDGTGEIQTYTLEGIQSLDAGYNWSDDDDVSFPYRGLGIVVPTLEEVFKANSEGVRMNIEIKQSEPSIVVPVCELIRDYGMTDRVLIASFNSDTIKAFRTSCPEVATTAGEGEVKLLYGLSIPFLAGFYQPAAEAVQVPEYWGDIHVLTSRLVSAAHNRGMDVHVWTVNEADDMQRMLDLGVDGIITDHPDMLLTLVGR